MMHMKYDDEIHEVESRLIHEREALVRGAEDLTQAAKCMATSPKGLAAAAVVGFLFGELTRAKRGGERESAPGSRTFGLSGILGGLALAAIRAQFGSPLGLGKAALKYASAGNRENSGAPAAGEDPLRQASSVAPIRARPSASSRE